MKYTLSLLFSLIFILFSCKKDDSLTSEEILTGSSWQMTSSIYNPPYQGDNGVFSDVFQIYSECAKDDLWIFNSGGTFHRNEGTTFCDQYDVWEMGFWALSQDNKKLYEYSLLYFYDYKEYDILKLTPSEMQLRYNTFTDTTQTTARTITDSFIRK